MLQSQLHRLFPHGLGNMVPELAYVQAPVEPACLPFLLVLSVLAVMDAQWHAQLLQAAPHPQLRVLHQVYDRTLLLLAALHHSSHPIALHGKLF